MNEKSRHHIVLLEKQLMSRISPHIILRNLYLLWCICLLEVSKLCGIEWHADAPDCYSHYIRLQNHGKESRLTAPVHTNVMWSYQHDSAAQLKFRTGDSANCIRLTQQAGNRQRSFFFFFLLLLQSAGILGFLEVASDLWWGFLFDGLVAVNLICWM